MSTTFSSDPTPSKAADLSATTHPAIGVRKKGLRMSHLAVLLALAVVLGGSWAARALLGGGGGRGSIDTFVVSPRSFTVVLKEKGELKAAKSTDIICEVEGRTTIISLVPEGTVVQEGDLLVELASDKIEERIQSEELKETNALTAYESAHSALDIQRDKNASDIRKAELEIELQQLALSKYEEGDWQQQLKDVTISIDQAVIMLERREEDWAAAQDLFERKFITRTKYDEDEFNFQKAGWDLERAKLAKDVLVRYTHVAELRKRESDLDEAVKDAERAKKKAIAEETAKQRALEGAEKELSLTRDQLAKFRGQREKCRIFAPTQGIVVYYGGGGGRHFMVREPIKEGGEVHERQVLMQLPDTTAMIAVVRVHEAKTDKLHLGQPVTLTVEGLPGKQFTGEVTKIAALADTQNRWLNPDLKEYETEILLDPTDEPLKPGVTAHVNIMVQSVDDRLAIPVQSVFSKGGRRYAMRTMDGQVSPVPVRLGAIGTVWVEVVEGLRNGDRVLLSLSEEQKRLIPDGPAKSRGHGKRAGRGKRAGGSEPGRGTHGKGRGQPATQTKHDRATDSPQPDQKAQGDKPHGRAASAGDRSTAAGTR